MVSSRSRRIKIIPPASPDPDSDIDQIESDTMDDMDILSDEEDMLVDEDNDMDPSDTSGLLDDDNEQVELEEDDENEDDEEEDDEEEEDEVIRPPTKSRNKRKSTEVADSEEEEFDSDLEVLRNQPMTKRQRAKHNKEEPEEYLELPIETGKKRHITEEEAALRKSEVARRRKNQSIQRAEKDKQDTINRLLKKQASKSKKIIKDDGTPDDQSPADRLLQLQDPHRLHYVSNQQGSTLSIPNKYTVDHIFGQDGDNKGSNNQVTRITQCQVEGCLGPRKYVATKSGKVVCSFDHYKLVEA
ncbi:PAPA-1-like conserved region-domain-containing protein [Chlamydoabsidia padenii]|nr:PAPA-1-like conserved region-domain-containing protein [Chlamydoabsidia padenii]